MCIMTSTIECSVFLAHVRAQNNVLLLQELKWMALWVKSGLLHCIPVPAEMVGRRGPHESSIVLRAILHAP